MEVPVSIFQESPLAGEPRERLFHIHSVHRYQLCKISTLLLFLLYINDLANASDVIFSLLFADDSNMFITGKNPDDLVTKMNAEILKVVDWLKINKLSLNLKKTHFIIFRKPRQKSLWKMNYASITSKLKWKLIPNF